YMMIFFGLLFYKVAAGLCIYFIASSLWGFAERKWLPKKKLVTDGETADSLYQKIRGDGQPPREEPRPVSNGQNVTAPSNRAKRRQERRKQRERGTVSNSPTLESEKEPLTPQASGWWARMREWWQDVLKKA